MRIVIWSLIAVALLAAPLLKQLADDWRAAGAEVTRALESVPTPAKGPLTLAEKAVVAAELADTWGRRGRPCRTLDISTLTRFLAGNDESLPGRSVSQALAGTSVFAPEEGAGSLRRHYEAVLISCRLERAYTDRELLRMWLPHADFGEGAQGLAEAAMHYFGKEPDALDLYEAARLAALLRNPSYFREREEAWAERARRIVEAVEARGDYL